MGDVAFRIDPAFLTSAPVLAMRDDVRLSAFGLWSMCGVWAAGVGSPGVIPDAVVRQFGATRRQVDDLLRVGLWAYHADGFVMYRPDLFLGSSKPVSRVPKAVVRTLGTRLSAEFAVSDDMRAWAAEKLPDVDVDAVTESFVDYWIGKSGRDATKVDWPATWRNWVRKSAERGASGPKSVSHVERAMSVIEQGRARDAARARKEIS